MIDRARQRHQNPLDTHGFRASVGPADGGRVATDAAPLAAFLATTGVSRMHNAGSAEWFFGLFEPDRAARRSSVPAAARFG
jgi:hypothetical protein